eukprot:11184814-Lingulodinium_polyedra.AAC.1
MPGTAAWAPRQGRPARSSVPGPGQWAAGRSRRSISSPQRGRSHGASGSASTSGAPAEPFTATSARRQSGRRT